MSTIRIEVTRGGLLAIVGLAVVSGLLTQSLGQSSGPQSLNHQGVVAVNGVKFNGAGQFRFALVANGGAGQLLWSNSPDANADGIPDAPLSLPVTNGVYSVALGAGGMPAVRPSLFSDPGVVLRVWFSDGVNGLQQLSPDQRLASAPYAAGGYGMVPVGTIQAWYKNPNGPGQPAMTLPDGWMECNGADLPADSPLRAFGANWVPNLNSAVGYDGGVFLRGHAESGRYQDGTGHFNGAGDNGGWTVSGGGWLWGADSQTVIAGPPDRAYTPNATVGQQTVYYSRTRPVNVSVVWIMRVK